LKNLEESHFIFCAILNTPVAIEMRRISDRPKARIPMVCNPINQIRACRLVRTVESGSQGCFLLSSEGQLEISR